MVDKNIFNNDFWNIIKLHYEKECYTDAIKDACLYIIELIQEKSELLDLDGETLINNAFSEKKPKLLINNNQTITEKDEQRGFYYLLRGIVCAIRNPISHKNSFKFTKEEADGILIFINNYILTKLDDSKDFSYVDDWYDFIFFDNLNDSEKYCDIILKSIPRREKLPLLIQIIQNLNFIKMNKYSYIINKLYNDLLKKEQEEIIILLNKKLINAQDDDYIRSFFSHFSPNIWSKLDNLVKARIENIIYISIKKGRIVKSSNTEKKEYINGSLGTWIPEWLEKFSNKKDIIDLLFCKLDNNEEAEYVLRYFSSIIDDRNILKKYSNKIKNGLKKGNKYYKNLLFCTMILEEDNEIVSLFKEDYDSFKDSENNHLDIDDNFLN